MPPSPAQIKAFVLDRLAQAAQEKALPLPSIGDQTNLLDLDLLDSLGFIGLLMALESELGLSLDLANRDPAQLTTLAGLAALAGE